MLKWSISYLDTGHTWQESRIHMKMALQYGSLDLELISTILEKSYRLIPEVLANKALYGKRKRCL